MDSLSRFLPKAFRWVFTVLAGLAALAAVCMVIAMIVDPTIPPGTHLGPKNVEILGQPGTIALRNNDNDSNFTATAIHNTIVLSISNASELVHVIVRHGLPVGLIHAVFAALLFELLRRLFRNVGRGESFTRQTVQLVQFVGFLLIVFSIVAAFAESWFFHAVYPYVASHALLTVEGNALHLPSLDGHPFPHSSGGSPIFFSGLLVLALSEVFRQGLALKDEHDLTV